MIKPYFYLNSMAHFLETKIQGFGFLPKAEAKEPRKTLLAAGTIRAPRTRPTWRQEAGGDPVIQFGWGL